MNYEKSSNIEHEENLTLFTFIQILATFGTKSVHSAGPSLTVYCFFCPASTQKL